MLLFALACAPQGPAYVASAAFDGPSVFVDPADGEASQAFVVGVEPVGADGKRAPRLTYGYDVVYTVLSDEPTTVRFVTLTDADAFVPTPWELDVDGEETFAQSSAAHECPGGEARCEAGYEVRVEVRDGAPVEVVWTVAAYVEGRAGSAEEFDAATVPTVGFE